MTFTYAAVSAAESGRRIEGAGPIELRIASEATGGRIAVWESITRPGEGPPMHMHTLEDEIFYVLKGSFRFWCGDESFVGVPGDTVVLPRNVPHTFENIGKAEGRLLVVATPGGFENFFIDVERMGAGDWSDVVAIGMKYGLSFMQPMAANEDRPAPRNRASTR